MPQHSCYTPTLHWHGAALPNSPNTFSLHLNREFSKLYRFRSQQTLTAYVNISALRRRTVACLFASINAGLAAHRRTFLRRLHHFMYRSYQRAMRRRWRTNLARLRGRSLPTPQGWTQTPQNFAHAAAGTGALRAGTRALPRWTT